MARAPDGVALLISAEHGGNEVPEPYRDLFRAQEKLLGSHRGWDPGTLPLARTLAQNLGAHLVEATVTRLLVDLNRSPTNPRVFSEITRPLSAGERARLLERYHRPHWDACERLVAAELDGGRRVLHLGIHSFTPRLNGSIRPQDLALLYDPRTAGERTLAADWLGALRSAEPALQLRRNHPYRGRGDGLTTALRRRFPSESYLGIEVEVSQRHVRSDGRFPEHIGRVLGDTLDHILDVARS